MQCFSICFALGLTCALQSCLSGGIIADADCSFAICLPHLSSEHLLFDQGPLKPWCYTTPSLFKGNAPFDEKARIPMKNERHALFFSPNAFWYCFKFGIHVLLKHMTYLLMPLFTSLFWKMKSVDVICAWKKISYMYNIKLVSVYGLVFLGWVFLGEGPSSPNPNILSKFDLIVCHCSEFFPSLFELNLLTHLFLVSKVPEKKICSSTDTHYKSFHAASEGVALQHFTTRNYFEKHLVP